MQTDRDFIIRPAAEQDCGLILWLIKQLAEYEHLAEQVTADEQQVFDSLFVRREAEVIIGEEHAQPVAYALFCHNYSTFLARANMYLEDLFVLESHRGKGYGAAMLRQVAEIAVQQGCKRLDWACLDWNTSSIAFYQSMGAVAMSDWTTFRLQGDALQAAAGK